MQNTGKRKIGRILKDFSPIFATDKYDVGTVKNYEVTVHLQEHRYISKKSYRCSISDQIEIESKVAKLLETDRIEESTSPFSAPVTLTFKREDGQKNRLCCDFQRLNELIVPESQTFPLIKDLMIRTRNCRYFTSLDINSAFWAIPLREKDRYKTAFVTQKGHYNWKCLPFGLRTSPAIFQRILSTILRRNNVDDFCINYIDGILIFPPTFKEHLTHLRRLFNAMWKEGFRLKFMKCKFAQDTVKYVGHVIEFNSV